MCLNGNNTRSRRLGRPDNVNASCSGSGTLSGSDTTSCKSLICFAHLCWRPHSRHHSPDGRLSFPLTAYHQVPLELLQRHPVTTPWAARKRCVKCCNRSPPFGQHTHTVSPWGFPCTRTNKRGPWTVRCRPCRYFKWGRFSPTNKLKEGHAPDLLIKSRPARAHTHTHIDKVVEHTNSLGHLVLNTKQFCAEPRSTVSQLLATLIDGYTVMRARFGSSAYPFSPQL